MDEFLRSSDHIWEVRDIKQTNNMKKIDIKDLEIGMRVDVWMEGEMVERGIIISIEEDEVIMMDGEEGFFVNPKKVEFSEIDYYNK